MEKRNQYDYLKEKLKQNKYKLTEQRQAILDSIVYNERKHLNCEEIFQSVKFKYPTIGLSTVYRTVHLLEGMGLLNRIDLDDGYTRYELNSREKSSHYHLICLKCKKISEVKEELMLLLEGLLYEKIRFAVKNRAVTFYGHCRQCLEEEGKNILRVT